MTLSIKAFDFKPNDIPPKGGRIEAQLSATCMPASELELTFKVLNGPYVFESTGQKTIIKKEKKVDKRGRDIKIPLDLVHDKTVAVQFFEIETTVTGSGSTRTPRRLINVDQAALAPAAAPMARAAAPMAAPAAAGPAEFSSLRQRREKAGKTQKELAAKAGVSVSTISRLERGGRCKPETRRKIEKAL